MDGNVYTGWSNDCPHIINVNNDVGNESNDKLQSWPVSRYVNDDGNDVSGWCL